MFHATCSVFWHFFSVLPHTFIILPYLPIICPYFVSCAPQFFHSMLLLSYLIFAFLASYLSLFHAGPPLLHDLLHIQPDLYDSISFIVGYRNDFHYSNSLLSPFHRSGIYLLTLQYFSILVNTFYPSLPRIIVQCQLSLMYSRCKFYPYSSTLIFFPFILYVIVNRPQLYSFLSIVCVFFQSLMYLYVLQCPDN